MKTYDVEPRIQGTIHVGSSARDIVIYAGQIAEAGRGGRVYLDLSKEFVLLEVGKRGSGKSYSMGALLEGLATRKATTSISERRCSPRGLLLLDPLDVHWTAIFSVSDKGSEEVKKQHALLSSWEDLLVEEVDVAVWMPAGKKTSLDPSVFKEYFVPVSSFDAGDWSDLLRADMVKEPRGQLLTEAYSKVTELGWTDGHKFHPPKSDYGIEDLLQCITGDPDFGPGSMYQAGTVRSIVQPLLAYQRLPLFSQTTGTPLTELVRPGALNILCLARLEPDLRTVVTSVIVKAMMKERRDASFLEKRLALENLSTAERTECQTSVSKHLARSILVLDEAQILLPADGSSSARKALESFVLEGRNYGLSLWLATQRPSGAISPAARSQVDIFMIHRLSVKEDITGMRDALQSDMPRKISFNRHELSFEDLVRSLDTGQAIVSSADTQAAVNRAFIANIRPRVTCHGGKAF